MNYCKAIAAMAANRVIGRENAIPWRLPEDFAWFKKITMGHLLLMGRKTYESIGGPLPGRETFVLSRQGRTFPGATTIRSLREIDPGSERRDIFVCGGAEIYQATLPYCSDLYLTRLKSEFPGDTHFPDFEDRFHPVERLLERPEFTIWRYVNPAPQAWPPADPD